MSTDTPSSEIQIAKLHLATPKPEDITAKRHDFPAAAALADMLKPYYDAALRMMDPNANAGDKKHVQAALHSDRLPESVTKEVRDHLLQLQTTALFVEASGAVKRAEEVREVAANLGSILDVIQRFCRSEKPGVARQQN